MSAGQKGGPCLFLNCCGSHVVYVTSHKSFLCIFFLFACLPCKHGIQLAFLMNVRSLWWWALNSVSQTGEALTVTCPWENFPSGVCVREEGFQGRDNWLTFLFLPLQVSVNPAYQARELEFVIRKVCVALAAIATWFLTRNHKSSCLLKGVVGARYRGKLLVKHFSTSRRGRESWAENRAGADRAKGTPPQWPWGWHCSVVVPAVAVLWLPLDPFDKRLLHSS